MALDRGAVDITRTASFFLIAAALKVSEGVAIASETATPIYGADDMRHADQREDLPADRVPLH